MITKFVGISTKIKSQHRKILKWLEESPKFRNAYVFLEFDIPGKGSRDVDFLIILKDQIHLLELKGERFTKIKNNSDWFCIDHKTGREVPYIKIKGRKKESPYQQATDTSDKLVKFIQTHASEFEESNRIQKFFRSKYFKIFPSVFIDDTHFLDKESIERDKWCRLCIGIQGLSDCLNRDFFHYSKHAINLDISSFSGLAAEMSLTNLTKKYTGRTNQTMLTMLKSIIDNNYQCKSSEEIREKVFVSETKRPVEVKDALYRAKSENILYLKESGYEIDILFQKLYNISESIEETYDTWGSYKILKLNYINYPDSFKLFATHLLDIELLPSDIKETSKIRPKVVQILHEIPRDLQYLSIDSVLFQEEAKTPLFFRDSGLQAIDIQHQYYCPFSDDYGFDLAQSLVQELQMNATLILQGEAGSGKSTLLRLIGFHLLEKQQPVLYMTPQDFSQDTIQSLQNFEKQTESDSDLFILIENVHLFSSGQVTHLQKLLNSPVKIKILLTTRQVEDPFLKELVESKEKYPNIEVIDLDKDGQALNRYLQLIKLYLLKTFPDITTYELDQIINRIKKLSGKILSLIQLHILVLKKINTKKELLQLLNSTRNFEEIFNSSVLQYVELNLSPILNDFPDKEEEIRKLYVALHIFAFLEIPLNQELIAKITKIDSDFIFDVFVHWEANNFARLDEYAGSNLHPVLAKKIYDIIFTNSEEFKHVKTNFENDLSVTQGFTLIDKFRQEIVQEDPTFLINLMHQKGPYTALINFEAIDMNRLKFYFDTLYLDDFMHLLYIIEMNFPRWGRKQWCEFFDNLTLEKIQEIVGECDSLGTLFQFFKFLREKGWKNFSKLVEYFPTNFYLTFLEQDRWNDRLLVQNLEEWGYSRITLVEFKLIFLEIRLMKKNPKEHFSKFSMRLSPGTIQAIDRLTVESIFQVIDGKFYILRYFMDFLNTISQQHKSDSFLRARIIETVLVDCIKDYDMSTYCYILSLLNNNLVESHPEWIEIIEQTNINHVLEELLLTDASWLKYYLKLIKPLSANLLQNFLASLTLEYVITLWEKPFENDYDSMLNEFIKSLDDCDWPFVTDFIEHFEVSFFLEKLDPAICSPYSEGWFEMQLLYLLMELDWPSKQVFLKHYRFKDLISNLHEGSALEIIKIYHQLGLPDTSLLLEITFKKVFQDFFVSSIENVIKQCDEFNIDWKIWVDIPFILHKLEKNFYNSRHYLDLLLEHGWELPAEINEYISSVKIQEEIQRLQRYSELEKAHYFYNHERKEEALKIFRKTINLINRTKNRDLLKKFKWNTENLESNDKKDLINRINSVFFEGIILDSERKFHDSGMLFRDLSKYGYVDIARVIFIHSIQTAPKLQKQFWTKIALYFKYDTYVEDIWGFYLDDPDYEKMGLLPDAFSTHALNSKDLIKARLFQDGELDSELWQFFLSTYLFTENENLEEIESLISQVFINVSCLLDLLKIMSFHSKMTDLILTKWKSLDLLDQQNIINMSNPLSIIRFMNLLEQEGEKEALISLLKLLSLENWEAKFENLSTDFKRNLIIIFQQGALEIFPKIDLIN